MSYLSRLKQLSGDEKITHSPRSEPTKPPKAPFVSYGSTAQGVYANISPASSSQKIGTGDTAMVPFDPHRRHCRAQLTADDERAIRAWLALIEETNPATIAEVIGQCQRDADARDYFIGRAAAELPKPDPFVDDRRTCTQCTNFRQGICSIAKPEVGALVVASRGYRPDPSRSMRCKGYAPKVGDPDQRPGAERWPGLREESS